MPAVLAITLLVLVAVSVASADMRHERTVGYGQIAYRGLGPEKWAAKWRAEHRLKLRALRERNEARRVLQKRTTYVHSDLPETFRAIVSGFLCIHAGEGSWTDDGAPYYGGLQMDRGFMGSYAPRALLERGTANAWTPLQQLAVGIIGYSLQGGFAPWPVTSRRCGLR